MMDLDTSSKHHASSLNTESSKRLLQQMMDLDTSSKHHASSLNTAVQMKR